VKGNPHAQTLSKAKAVEALTEAKYDLKAATMREQQAENDLQLARNAKLGAQGRVEDAEAHLNRAIEKEMG